MSAAVYFYKWRWYFLTFRVHRNGFHGNPASLNSKIPALHTLRLRYGCLYYPILYTAWLNNHALTLKRNTAKYYYGEKSSFLHTFLKLCCESRKIYVKLKDFLISML
jgi:hypothetical protein